MRKFLLLADLPAFTVCVSDLPCSGASPVLVPVSVSPLVLLVLLVLLVSPLVVLVPGSPVLVSTTPVVDASVVESVVGESVVGESVVGGTVGPRRHPDHMACSAARSGGADRHFIHIESRLSQPLGEARVGSG